MNTHSHMKYMFSDFWAGKTIPRNFSENSFSRMTSPQVSVSYLNL